MTQVWNDSSSNPIADIQAVKRAIREVPTYRPEYVIPVGLHDAVKADMEKRGVTDLNEWMRVAFQDLTDEEKALLLYDVWRLSNPHASFYGTDD